MFFRWNTIDYTEYTARIVIVYNLQYSDFYYYYYYCTVRGRSTNV